MIVPSCPPPSLRSSMSKRQKTVTLYAPESGHDRRQRRPLLPYRQTPQQQMAAFNRVRCECGSVARGSPNHDNRCYEALNTDELDQGRTLCSRCRPDCIAISRGRRIARTLEAMIQRSGKQFEPPLNFERSRLRHIGMLLLKADPRCHCPCGYCGPQNVPHQPEPLTLQNTMSDLQLAQEDVLAARADLEVMLISRILGYAVWDLPSWVPDGRYDGWVERQRSDWARLEAAMDPNRDFPWFLD